MAVAQDGFSIDLEVDAFQAWTQAAVKELKANDARLFLRKTAVDFVKRVIEKTPVDKGRARAAWQSLLLDEGVNIPISGPSVDQSEVAKGLTEGSFREGGLFGADQFIEIINGVNYIIFLEFGSSKQAPGGMVRITFTELRLKGTMSRRMSEQLGKTYAQINRRMRTQRAAGRGRGFGAFAAIG